MSEYTYDALLVLGAVMQWDNITKKWDFPAIIEDYAGKLVCGKVRAQAASLLHQQAPILLVTGGSNIHPITGERCSRSIELSRVIAEYGVPKEKIVPMGTLGASHTLGNSENLVAYIEANPSIIQNRKIGIISPKFQAERARLMFQINPYFAEHHIDLVWIIAEEEIEKKYPEMKEYFAWLYSTPEAAINAELENKGIADLLSGKYKPVS